MARPKAERTKLPKHNPLKIRQRQNGGLFYKTYYVDGKQKTVYLGRDFNEAEAQWKRFKNAAVDDEKKREQERKLEVELQENPTVEYLCHRFIQFKNRKHEEGDLTYQNARRYRSLCADVRTVFGGDTLLADITPDHFRRLRNLFIEREYKPTSMQTFIRMSKAIFRYGQDEGLIGRLKFGAEFAPPSTDKIVKYKQTKERRNGERRYEREELLRMLKVASGKQRAILLLSLNLAMGATDLTRFEWSEIRDGYLYKSFRNKSSKRRLGKLWPETLDAINKIKTKSPLVFGDDETRYKINHKFKKLECAAGTKRDGRGLYACRHTFASVAENLSQDDRVIGLNLGHSERGLITRTYQSTGAISTERIDAVSDAVRNWLFSA